MTFRIRRRLNRRFALVVLAVDDFGVPRRAEIVHEDSNLRACLDWTLSHMGPRDTLDAKVTI